MLHLQSFGHCQDWCIRQWSLCLQTYKRRKVSWQHLQTEDELLPFTLSHGQLRAEWSSFSHLEENGEEVVFRLLNRPLSRLLAHHSHFSVPSWRQWRALVRKDS
jgi:hypothetical protein